MANYTAADVKRLRELTGSGMMDCKNALAENDGDYDKAVEYLRIKGAKDVGKRAERNTAEGLVVAEGDRLDAADQIRESGGFDQVSQLVAVGRANELNAALSDRPRRQ